MRTRYLRIRTTNDIYLIPLHSNRTTDEIMDKLGDILNNPKYQKIRIKGFTIPLNEVMSLSIKGRAL